MDDDRVDAPTNVARTDFNGIKVQEPPMTSAWLLIQKFYHGELMGIPVVRWAAFLTLTLVVFLTLRVLVTAVRSRLKARSVLTEPRLNDYLLQLLERTWTLSLLAGSALVAISFVGLRAAEVAGESGVEGTVRLLAMLLISVLPE